MPGCIDKVLVAPHTKLSSILPIIMNPARQGGARNEAANQTELSRIHGCAEFPQLTKRFPSYWRRRFWKHFVLAWSQKIATQHILGFMRGLENTDAASRLDISRFRAFVSVLHQMRRITNVVDVINPPKSADDPELKYC
jgi:hypothetical protein